jgi:hypothetical protein
MTTIYGFTLQAWEDLYHAILSVFNNDHSIIRPACFPTFEYLVMEEPIVYVERLYVCSITNTIRAVLQFRSAGVPSIDVPLGNILHRQKITARMYGDLLALGRSYLRDNESLTLITRKFSSAESKSFSPKWLQQSSAEYKLSKDSQDKILTIVEELKGVEPEYYHGFSLSSSALMSQLGFCAKMFQTVGNSLFIISNNCRPLQIPVTRYPTVLSSNIGVFQAPDTGEAFFRIKVGESGHPLSKDTVNEISNEIAGLKFYFETPFKETSNEI